MRIEEKEGAVRSKITHKIIQRNEKRKEQKTKMIHLTQIDTDSMRDTRTRRTISIHKQAPTKDKHKRTTKTTQHRKRANK